MDATVDQPITVVLVDDSAAYRLGMARAIQRHEELDLIGEFDGGLAGLAAIEDLDPDVVVLDFRMPDIDGIQVCERVRGLEERVHTKALLISADIDEPTRALALASGASCVMSKGASRRDICTAAVSLARAGRLRIH
ncbi:response regulator transcription factor [Paraconexibacter sp.]|uniref:response regulator n=1 Tax=Paraconexibacter sp. TaxID=2949640 RepID=UPI0035695888